MAHATESAELEAWTLCVEPRIAVDGLAPSRLRTALLLEARKQGLKLGADPAPVWEGTPCPSSSPGSSVSTLRLGLAPNRVELEVGRSRRSLSLSAVPITERPDRVAHALVALTIAELESKSGAAPSSADPASQEAGIHTFVALGGSSRWEAETRNITGDLSLDLGLWLLEESAAPSLTLAYEPERRFEGYARSSMELLAGFAWRWSWGRWSVEPRGQLGWQWRQLNSRSETTTARSETSTATSIDDNSALAELSLDAGARLAGSLRLLLGLTVRRRFSARDQAIFGATRYRGDTTSLGLRLRLQSRVGGT